MSQTSKNNAEKDNYYHNKVPRPVTTKMKTLTACRRPSNSWQYTSLAEDLRQVIECDIQMDCLSKKRSALLTQVLQNQNQPFQLIMVQQQSRSERKASRSPPNKKRRTMPQAAAGLPRASTSDSVGFPPVHPDLRRHDEDPQPRLPPQQGRDGK